MSISIVDYELPYDSHNLYDVSFDGERIHTLVTHSSTMVERWLTEINSRNHGNIPVVGLDVEWRPNFNRGYENRVATLQLCVGHDCLIYQVIHAEQIPQPLFEFLANVSHAFVGVGIESDVEKLIVDYDLCVGNMVDIGIFAAAKFGARQLRSAGLKGLAREILGKEIGKPKRVTMSRWDNEWLTRDQVQYACVDAFLSFEIARHLNVNNVAPALGTSAT